MYNAFVVAEISPYLISLDNSDISSEMKSLESFIPGDILNTWKAVLGRFDFLYSRNILQYSEITTNNSAERDIDSSSEPTLKFIAYLTSLLDYDPPLPGSEGAMKPRRPPPANHFKRHHHPRI